MPLWRIPVDLFTNCSIAWKLLVTNINNISDIKAQDGRHIQNDFGFKYAVTARENKSHVDFAFSTWFSWVFKEYLEKSEKLCVEMLSDALGWGKS